MKAQTQTCEQPDFCMLSELMDRFHQVPFEIFQKELNEWFKNCVAELPPGFKNIHDEQGIGFAERLVAIGDQLFKQAEAAEVENLLRPEQGILPGKREIYPFS